MADFSLSIVVPAYNEEVHLGASLASIMRFARTYPALREVIIVDDGSTDDTAAIVEADQLEYATSSARVRLIRQERNLGKGAAVRRGMLEASGDIVLFTDADLSSPIEEVRRLVRPIVEGRSDVAIGSRAIDRSLIGVRQGWFRETAGRMFNVLVRILTRLPIRDTQCGFKAFRRDPILPVFRMQRVNTFAFDVEVLYLARKRGLRITELAVRWDHMSHTKVDMLRDSMRMLIDVIRIRVNELRGRYRTGDAR